jgi:hypothetical protein
MARKAHVQVGDYVLFDVFYEDGGRASNRKVPLDVVGGIDGDAPALTFILDQERKIGDLSGRGMRAIKEIRRTAR